MCKKHYYIDIESLKWSNIKVREVMGIYHYSGNIKTQEE